MKQSSFLLSGRTPLFHLLCVNVLNTIEGYDPTWLHSGSTPQHKDTLLGTTCEMFSLFSTTLFLFFSLSLNTVDTGTPPRLSTRPSSLAAD